MSPTDTLLPSFLEAANMHMELGTANEDWSGGIWPMIGTFWVLALAKRGRREEAARALEAVAAANALREWEFNEWLHGRTGEPSGMPGQSWNAAGLLLAHHALSEPVFPLSRAEARSDRPNL